MEVEVSKVDLNEQDSNESEIMEVNIPKTEDNNSIDADEEDSSEDLDEDLEDIITVDTGKEFKLLQTEEGYNFSDSDDEIEKEKFPVKNKSLFKEFIETNQIDFSKNKKKQNDDDIDIDKVYDKFSNLDTVIEKPMDFTNLLSSTGKEIKPLPDGWSKLHELPSTFENRRQAQLRNQMIREKSKGKNWYNLPAPEITPEIKQDLQILQMRSALDPKQFYKRNDIKGLPKFFQMGKIVESPLDYYSSRLTKKEKKRSLVEELMADAEFRRKNKDRYTEIIQKRRKTHYRAHKQQKKLKKNKK